MKTPTESLPCDLSDSELREKATEHANKLNQIDKLESELDGIKKQFKGSIEELERAEFRLRGIVETGIEYREIEIQHRPNFEDDTMETYRIDTGEFIRARPLEKDERQILLFNEKQESEAS